MIISVDADQMAVVVGTRWWGNFGRWPYNRNKTIKIIKIFRKILFKIKENTPSLPDDSKSLTLSHVESTCIVLRKSIHFPLRTGSDLSGLLAQIQWTSGHLHCDGLFSHRARWESPSWSVSNLDEIADTLEAARSWTYVTVIFYGKSSFNFFIGFLKDFVRLK